MPKSLVTPPNLKASQHTKRRLPGEGWKCWQGGGDSVGHLRHSFFIWQEQYLSWSEHFTVTVTFLSSLLDSGTDAIKPIFNSHSSKMYQGIHFLHCFFLRGDLKYESRLGFNTVVSLIQELLTYGLNLSSTTSPNYIKEISFPLSTGTLSREAV